MASRRSPAHLTRPPQLPPSPPPQGLSVVLTVSSWCQCFVSVPAQREGSASAGLHLKARPTRTQRNTAAARVQKQRRGNVRGGGQRARHAGRSEQTSSIGETNEREGGREREPGGEWRGGGFPVNRQRHGRRCVCRFPSCFVWRRRPDQNKSPL